jgi:hypothetical protein
MHNIKPLWYVNRNIKEKKEWSSLIPSTITVYEAWDNGRKKCWAVLVIEDDNLKGILSERLCPKNCFEE